MAVVVVGFVVVIVAFDVVILVFDVVVCCETAPRWQLSNQDTGR